MNLRYPWNEAVARIPLPTPHSSPAVARAAGQGSCRPVGAV